MYDKIDMSFTKNNALIIVMSLCTSVVTNSIGIGVRQNLNHSTEVVIPYGVSRVEKKFY